MDTNLPKESSSAVTDVENEPPHKKQHSITYYFGEATQILLSKKSLEAVKSKKQPKTTECIYS